MQNQTGANPCRACRANRHTASQSLCDECHAQLGEELDRRGLRSWSDVLKAWKCSAPDSYAAFRASTRGEPQNQEAHEFLGSLLAADSILYYAQLVMTEDRSRRLWTARFGSPLDVISDATSEPAATETTEERVGVMSKSLPRQGSMDSIGYDVPDGYPADWHELRHRVYRRDGFTCQDCYVSGVRVVAHHIVPLWDGGSNGLSNLVTLCERCHEHRHVLISAERAELRRERQKRLGDRQFKPAMLLPAAVVVAAVLISGVIARLAH